MQSDWFYQILVILHEHIVLDRPDRWSARLWRALQSNGLDVPDYQIPSIFNQHACSTECHMWWSFKCNLPNMQYGGKYSYLGTVPSPQVRNMVYHLWPDSISGFVYLLNSGLQSDSLADSLAWPDRYFFVGAGKNRVWHIPDTKLVLTPNKFWLGVN